jgi:hypothetical protein
MLSVIVLNIVALVMGLRMVGTGGNTPMGVEKFYLF